MSKGRFFCGGSALAVTLALTLGVAPGFAQQRQAEEATEVEEIISTGTFIRGTAEDSAINVEVTGRDELLQRGSPTTEELLRNLSEIGNLQGGFARGANADGLGISAINLRGLGSGRTLVLMNGRRLADDAVSSGATGSSGFITGGANQNVNVIPTAALQQVEILKDAGGTTYGSDAVGGVVNFITRRDLHGMEVDASYKYVNGSDGDYAASLLWGRRNNSGNVLLSLEYTKRSALPALEGNNSLVPFYVNGNTAAGVTFSPYANIGSYVFMTPTGTISPTGTGVNLYQGGTIGLATGGFNPTAQLFPAIGGQVPGGAASAQFPYVFGTALGNPPIPGALRDDACLKFGGLRTYGNLSATPQCAVERARVENLYEQEENYRLFGDVNLDLTDTIRYHGEFLGTKTTTALYDGIEDYSLQAPCDPYPLAAANGVGASPRACTNANATNNGYQVAGYNPAVRDYVLRYYTNPTNGSAAQRVFTDAQITALTGNNIAGTLTPGGGGGVSIGQGYNPVGFGRVNLAVWTPFVVGLNPAFASGTAPARQENNTFRTTQQLKGDLGEIWGNQIDYDLAVTYQYNLTRYKDQGLLSDRLQRGLNGFASNLDDFGSDGCSASETRGTRTVQRPGTTGVGVTDGLPNQVTVTGVPYTTGAGGGAGRAANGFDPGSSAGNGCYFFNPFSSAYARSRINGADLTATATDVGFVAASAPGANDYQGYAPGFGLSNAPGIVRWMYAERENRQQNDTVLADLVFNGSLLNFELPGGPIAWAFGGQYRYTHRSAGTSGLNDVRINPCSFLSRETQAQRADANNLNPISTCGSTIGLFADDPATGAQGATAQRSSTGYRESVAHALFAELNLPVWESINSSFQLRYEESKSAGSPFTGALVGSGNVKWQINDMFAFRVNASETFDNPNIPDPDVNTFRQGDLTASIFTGLGAASINPATSTININNLFLRPENGFAAGAGILFSSPDRSLTASIDYFYNAISGRGTTISATDIARALQGLGSASAPLIPGQVINCSDPTVQALFNNTQSVLGRPIVQYINTLGEIQPGGCRANTRLEGVDNNNNGVTIDAVDDALSISYLNSANSGTQKAAGIEMGVNYRLPVQVYGGDLSVGADVTVNLRNTSTAVSILGVQVADATDNIGQLASSFLQFSVIRGSISSNYVRDKHALSMQGQFVGGFADNATTPFGGAVVPGYAGNNLNPENPDLCAAQNLSGLPLPTPHAASQALAPLLVGDRPYNPNCNVPIFSSVKVPTSFILNATYRYEMPWNTTLNVTVDNVLDAPGAFLRAPFNYSGFSGVSPAGRTIKVGFRKKFSAAAN